MRTTIIAVTFAAVASLAAAGTANADNTIGYDSYSFNGGNTNIAYASDTIYGGAGLITLNTAQGGVDAWCVDVQDWLASSGTYTVQQNVAGIDNSQMLEIAALMYAPTAVSEVEATQLAIWITEYGNGVTLTPDDPNALTQAVALLEQPLASSGEIEFLVDAGNQTLVTKASAVSEPGTMALLGVGMLGIGLVSRRKQDTLI